MRGAKRRNSLLIAAFAMLLAIAAPHAAHAQAPTPFNINTCMQNQATGVMKHAQEQLAGFSRIFNNASIPSLNTQCFNYLLGLFNMFTGDIDPTNLIIKVVMTIVLTTIIQAVNQLCQQVMMVVQSAVTFAKSLLCLPLPGLSGVHLQLPTFGGGHCNGINIINAINMANMPSRTPPPGTFNWFGYQPQ
jgi:hypothetical protein